MLKEFEPMVGMIAGVGTWGIIDQVGTAILVAFFSAIAAWLGRQLCIWIKNKITQKNAD